jgi:hypothetical protein
MFTHRLVIDAFYRFVVSVVVLIVGCLFLGYMASNSVVWWVIGSVLTVFLIDDCMIKWMYLKRQFNYTERGRTYPHFLLQLAELYPNYIHVPEETDMPADDHDEFMGF